MCASIEGVPLEPLFQKNGEHAQFNIFLPGMYCYKLLFHVHFDLKFEVLKTGEF